MWNSSLSSRKCASSFLYKSSRPNECWKIWAIPFSVNKSIWLKIEKIVLSGWLLGRCIYARKLHVRLLVSYIVSVSWWRRAHISSAITSKGHCVHTGPGLFVYSPSSSIIPIPHTCHFFYTCKIFGESNLHRNLHSKLPIFCVKSVRIYTGQKKFTRAPPVAPMTNMRYDAPPSPTVFRYAQIGRAK